MRSHSDKIEIQYQALQVSETTEQNRRPTEIDLLEVIFDLDTDGTSGRDFGPMRVYADGTVTILVDEEWKEL